MELMNQALAWERTPPHEGFVLKAPHRDGEGTLKIASGPDWEVEFVLPWVGDAAGALVKGDDPNACSAVLRVTRGGGRVLIGGDAPLGSWERLPDPVASVIRTPHHGGEIRHGGHQWSAFEDLYKAVECQTVVVSVGTHNGHHHPLPEHVTAARRNGACRVLCTQLTRRCHPDPRCCGMKRSSTPRPSSGPTAIGSCRVIEGRAARRQTRCRAPAAWSCGSARTERSTSSRAQAARTRRSCAAFGWPNASRWVSSTTATGKRGQRAPPARPSRHSCSAPGRARPPAPARWLGAAPPSGGGPLRAGALPRR